MKQTNKHSKKPSKAFLNKYTLIFATIGFVVLFGSGFWGFIAAPFFFWWAYLAYKSARNESRK